MRKAPLASNIRFFLPASMAVFLVLLGAIPFRLPGLSAFLPLMDFMIIFYFAIYWPGALSSAFILALGLLKDGLYGAPMGVSSLLGLALWHIITHERHRIIEAPFFVVWAVFLLVALFFAIVQWLIYSFLVGNFLPVGSGIMQWLLTAAFYPFLHGVCDELRDIAGEEIHYEQ